MKTKRSLWEKGVEADGDAVQEEDVADLDAAIRHGATASVLVANEKVYVAYESPTRWRVLAREGRTGKQLWVTDLPLPMARFASFKVTRHVTVTVALTRRRSATGASGVADDPMVRAGAESCGDTRQSRCVDTIEKNDTAADAASTGARR
ncbi:MAG: hypothetical protein KIT84_19530 [Labilithrix sp.]|nr:hypothetical protein [Labilithrix sp.]MCW5813228.1 hypothetical protein [Labilithrix sp.]